jgi:hypothetical protein
VALSLLEKRGLDPVDMAARFWKAYKEEPWRGYGASVAAVFHKLGSILLNSIWAQKLDG